MPTAWFQWDGDDLILSLHVQPGARSSCVDGLHGDRLKVRLNAPPVDGKANACLISFLATLFGVPQRAVTLLSGHAARSKRVRIARPVRLLPDIPGRPG